MSTWNPLRRLTLLGALGATLAAHGLSAAWAQTRPATDPTAPTAATLSPAEIDAIWRKSVAKFDGERARVLRQVQAGVAAGPFRADWTSLQAYRTPSWYADAKFGIFVHWGVFSLPAFGNEWYSREMYQEGSKPNEHHAATFGSPATFGYKDLIARFKAERFDPQAWAQLFAQAGARYVVPVAEHHDGFAMYRSSLSDWTAATMGPRRDVLGELAKAIRAEGMHFGTSSHRAEHNWFFDGGRRIASDVNDPRYAALYGPAQLRVLHGKDDGDLPNDWTPVSQAWLDDWLARTAELVDRYQPDLMYFDWWIGHASMRVNTMPGFAAYYYNQGARRGEPTVINFKLNAFPQGAGTYDVERGQMIGIQPHTWQTDTSISNASWGYIDGDTYKPATQLLHQLVDVVSKNGNLLLNIGPRGDGSIPEQARDILLEMGAWLKVNGEAIYGSRPWTRFGEGPTEVVGGTFQDRNAKPYTPEDFRFTTRGPVLYAIGLGWPQAGADGRGELLIRSLAPSALAAPVKRVTLLADRSAIPFTQDASGLHLQLPKEPVGRHAYVFKIEAQ
ncbi:alpha-L-fucosidase [Roseateles sp.]|uniref:alpha-L-fucosidase n=1 Tax=Roseateles sp. TaxID=1971397 RepID=UPI002DFFF1E3|nr:alpha-L-fucosidase [Roseateles sp.]HEV6967046.1 alpha-L-fucosidase [Roseateles sp.]